MNRLSHIADELATEVLSEAAETFFGQRKSLEDELEHFYTKAKQLDAIGKRALQMQSVLHCVLLEERIVRGFYRMLALPEPETVESASKEILARQVFKQRAWTLRGRFYKLLAAVYSGTQAAADEYLHGSYRDDPTHPKKKIAVIGYQKLMDWAETLNRNITKLNTEQSPNEVLSFVKALNDDACTAEKAAGGSCEIGRDRGMLYTCIDISALALPDLPEYPHPSAIQPKLRLFAAQTYAECRPQVQQLFQELAPLWR